MLLRVIAVFAFVLTIGPARADVTPEIANLAKALQLAEVALVLREEGLVSAGGMLREGPPDPLWQATVDGIYDKSAMEQTLVSALGAELAAHPDAINAAMGFFGSELGQRALRLELEARRALADEGVEATAEAAYAALAKENPARQAQLDAFVAANDLIESNVMGAMNANLAFLRGVASESPKSKELSEGDLVAQVWSGESEARQETVKWLFPFLNLAYQPLTDDELQAYIDFSESSAGKQVNAAMFRAFDKMFDALSRDLGRAYVRQLVGQDI